MQTLLYLDDSYMKEWDAKVGSVDRGKYIVLDRTAFFPKGGGLPSDMGWLSRRADGKKFRVVFAGKFSGLVSHEVDQEGLAPGDMVSCGLDWDRRYRLMRIHTACHILCSVFYRNANALVTGNQLDVGQSRIDFDMQAFEKSAVERYIAEANSIFAKGVEVKAYYMDREEALKTPEMVKLKNALPPDVPRLRIVEIPGIDTQADGGPHVANTKEIGSIRLVGMANKGKENRRVYIELAS